MSRFEVSISKTLIFEGGYVNDAADHGGETNFGISKSSFPDLDIKNLTREQAVEIYREQYWKDLYSQIDNQDIADKLFDLGVLFGVGTAVKLLQKALKIAHDDSFFGPNTLAELNSSDPVKVLEDYKAEFVERAITLCANRPNQRMYLKGWLRRINS